MEELGGLMRLAQGLEKARNLRVGLVPLKQLAIIRFIAGEGNGISVEDDQIRLGLRGGQEKQGVSNFDRFEE